MSLTLIESSLEEPSPILTRGFLRLFPSFQVALEHIPDDGTRTHLREIYNPVVLFIAFMSIACHGITVPLSKLGPGVIRRTATLTKTRSITFSRPNSRANSVNGDERHVSSSSTCFGVLRYLTSFPFAPLFSFPFLS